MQVIALLRGVMPTGENRIPKMSELVEILENVGFKNVKTYIQSGNILLETDLSHSETASKIHDIIYKEIGANLSVIIKIKEEFEISIKENPFDDSYDFSRIHLVFTNSQIDNIKIEKLKDTIFEGEIFSAGNECFYMYLQREAIKKRLNNNYLERKLGIIATTRKLNVVKKLHSMVEL